MTDGDRTVHGRTLHGVEVVRYDRRGHWCKEWHGRSERISLAEAVSLATAPGSAPYLNLPGGRMFDAKVRKRRGF